MSIFYRREETDTEVKIIYTSLAIRMYLTWGLLLLLLVISQYAKEQQDLLLGFILLPILFFIFFSILIVFNIAYWKPMKETRKAIKKGAIKVSGSRWSLKNPRTITISKS